MGEPAPKRFKIPKKKAAAVADRWVLGDGDAHKRADNPEELSLPDCADGGEAPAAERQLVVLDVNGLLIDRVLAAHKDDEGEAVEPDSRVGQFFVYDRPGMRAFVSMLLDRFVVGVWSSARLYNLTGLVEHIFGAEKHRLAFVWGQEHCTYAGMSAAKKPLFLKELGRLWSEEGFAQYAPHNTLLVDDDAYKAARNPPFTAIHPSKFSWAAVATDSALCSSGELWTYLAGLGSSGTRVTEWVQATPFVGGEAMREGGEGLAALRRQRGGNVEPAEPTPNAANKNKRKNKKKKRARAQAQAQA